MPRARIAGIFGFGDGDALVFLPLGIRRPERPPPGKQEGEWRLLGAGEL